MKPVYKSIYDFRKFFGFLQIEIVRVHNEVMEGILEENPESFLNIWPLDLPRHGLHIYLNRLDASFEGNYLFDSEFKKNFDLSGQNILTELHNNIKCSTSKKELNNYLTELHFVLKNCQDKIIETRVNADIGIQCSYTYKGSKTGKTDINQEDEQISKEYLSDLLYWIKNQIRDLAIQTDDISKSIEPIAEGAKLIKSFKFINPKYSHVKIPSVFNDLRDRKFIDMKTKPEQLEEVFLNIIIDKPIKWIGWDGDLKVLIHSLINKKIIIDPKRSIWDITRTCFIKDDGSLFKNADLRGSKDTLRANEVKFIVRKFLD
jgi:hypothetical protein